jgi:arginine-tRNA-protein transferase
MFAPEFPTRSLGVFTMLLEIKYAFETGKKFYYHGYAYEGNSFYDYKKRFRGLENYDWIGAWRDFREEESDWMI